MGASAKAGEPAPEARRDGAEADGLMRGFFERFSAVNPPPPRADAALEAASARSRRNFDATFELLDRAAQAFDDLSARCQRLERDLREADERARERAVAQDLAVDRWKQLASDLTARAAASDEAAAALRVRCDAAETRAAVLESRAAEAQREAAQAAGHVATLEQLRARMHDRVVEAFGMHLQADPATDAPAAVNGA